MNTGDIILSILTMCGGLAFFLYGMNIMSASLEKMAGGKLESALKKATAKPFIGFVLGVGITVAMQSSSAMTVMLVGLVNSGIMSFTSTIAPILGSNVGTTFTAWILSLMGIEGDTFSPILLLSPEYLSPLMGFIGIILRMFGKKNKQKDTGTILLGFAVLMYGMEFMGNSVNAIKNMEGFDKFIGLFENPIVALLISVVFTGIIQSSAATIGIVQNLSLIVAVGTGMGAISYKMAIPLVLGANIGTCVTALISAIGTTKNAQRVVVVHFYVNTVGSIICMLLMGLLMPIPAVNDFLNTPTNPFTISLIHTFFNLINGVLMALTTKLMLKVIYFVVPDKKGEAEKHVFLDERLLNTPQMAIEECRNLTNKMANLAKDAINKSILLLSKYDDEGYQEVADLEALTDRYEDKLGSFLVKLSSNDLSEKDSKVVGRLLHTIGDLERIGDHAENIAEVAREIKEKEISFSSYANDEIKVITSAIKEIVDITTESFCTDNIALSQHVEPLEQVIDVLKKSMQEKHVQRMQQGKCSVELGFVFSDLITNYERVSDHCSNIAIYTATSQREKTNAHKYSKIIKNLESSNYQKDFEFYSKKYSI